ncbi:MAG TPA: hypothetical protein HA252_04095 [Candidatus Diapherotrites archaeon]|uniref:Uncharacterized protein n=1 Tax=Candidatus Iainarchaeum sp. TaxID=3101447 RepID=A0A7J4JFR7_9ARCH|nr:hypothetical protein [Candidatus Diapherotrites archaeon]HIH16558.1 hypothetical protein [Candidatus Diapherotrites archaeon]
MGMKRAAIYTVSQWARIWERLGYKPSEGKASEIKVRLALGRARGHRRQRDPKRRLRFLTRERKGYEFEHASPEGNVIGNALMGNFDKVLRFLHQEEQAKYRQTNRPGTNWSEGLVAFIDCLPPADPVAPEPGKSRQAPAKAPLTPGRAPLQANANFLTMKPGPPSTKPGDEFLERASWSALEDRKARKPLEVPGWVKIKQENFHPLVVDGRLHFFVHGVRPSNREIRAWTDATSDTARKRGLDYNAKTAYLGDARQAAVWFLKRFSREAVRVYALNRIIPFHAGIAERVGGELAETMSNFNPPLFLEQLLNGYRNEVTSEIRGPTARRQRLKEVVTLQAHAAGIDPVHVYKAAYRLRLQGKPAEEAARQAIQEYQEQRRQAELPPASASTVLARPRVPAPASAAAILPVKEKKRNNGPATTMRPPESPRQPATHRLVLSEEHFWKPEEDWLNGLRDHRPGLVEALVTLDSRLNQFLEETVRSVLPRRMASNPEIRRRYAFGVVNAILSSTREARAMHQPMTWFLDKSRAHRAPGGYMLAVFTRLLYAGVFQPHQAGRKYHSYELNFAHPIVQCFLP